MFITFLRDGIRLQLMWNRTLIRGEIEFDLTQIGVYLYKHKDTKAQSFYYTQKSTQILQKYLCQIFEDFCPLFFCLCVQL